MYSSLRLIRNKISGKHGMSGMLQTDPQPLKEMAAFDIQPYEVHRLDQSPCAHVTMTRAEGLKYYKEMETIRQLENAVRYLYEEFRAVRGLCHLYSGQEACCVGMEAAIQKDDAVITTYRCHGWAFLRGISLRGILAEATGKVSGCSQGKGGSMHMYAPHNKFYGGFGITGAQVPVGSGIAFAMKYEDKPNICLTSYGDGSANQGQIFEAFNMAKLWNLPVIFVCENNGYGMWTGAKRSSASTEYYKRGDYLPGIRVDGMDVLAVREATKFAREFALKNGPIILEAMTYRFYGHNTRESGKRYRDEEERKNAEHRDPINTNRKRLLHSGMVTTQELQKIDFDISQEVFEVAKKALSDPEPPLDRLYKSSVKRCDSTLQAQKVAKEK